MTVIATEWYQYHEEALAAQGAQVRITLMPSSARYAMRLETAKRVTDVSRNLVKRCILNREPICNHCVVIVYGSALVAA
ncbi:MAG: hypothetical protein HKN27_03350 [Silicimonas sp.]|nr:hypothetical protein [Silicimonas sp.]